MTIVYEFNFRNRFLGIPSGREIFGVFYISKFSAFWLSKSYCPGRSDAEMYVVLFISIVIFVV